MMTDGIVDAFEGREVQLEKLLQQTRIVNPKELAEYIVEEAVRQDDGRVRDDMSVVVAAIWERTRENACVPSYKTDRSDCHKGDKAKHETGIVP